ncbi:MAG: hypothetical protein QME96_07645, partial [Myxococcota bacterium]|nr:hypothetical protein [Myxococcota bacterium]
MIRGSRPARRPAAGARVFGAAALVLAVAAGCKDRAPDAAAAARELRALERILAEVSSTEIHPRLQDADLAPLRLFKAADERVLRVRETCLRQYEEIVRTYRDLDRCAELERTLAGFLRGPGPDAGDPATVLDEAQQ